MAAEYTLPPEWAPQQSVQLTWPHPDTDWGPRLESVLPVFARIAREISLSEDVLNACHDPTSI